MMQQDNFVSNYRHLLSSLKVTLKVGKGVVHCHATPYFLGIEQPQIRLTSSP